VKVIRLYGQLAKFIGERKFLAEVASAAEAVRFLVANYPQLETHMADGQYRVLVGKRDIDCDELHHPSGDKEEIRIIPVIAGAGVVGRIILGAALLVAAFAIPGFAAWAGPTAYSLVVGVGASLFLGGVAQLLTPVPKVPSGNDSQDDPRRSYSFSGIQNTSRQGVPVPICYGEVLVGSVVISAGIDFDQVVA
jgi:predicted phage tail protein